MLYDKQNDTRFLIGFNYDLLKDRRIGDVSINKIWVRQFAKRYCKNIDIKLVFLGNMFGVKDPIPRGLRTYVVYKFLCAGCNACYVGETSRHLSTRVSERLVSDRTSHFPCKCIHCSVTICFVQSAFCDTLNSTLHFVLFRTEYKRETVETCLQI